METSYVFFFSTLIRDFQIADVADVTPGSGAACLASLYSKVSYTGVAYNEKHEAWLRELLQRMFVSMVISNDVVADADLVKKRFHISQPLGGSCQGHASEVRGSCW